MLDLHGGTKWNYGPQTSLPLAYLASVNMDNSIITLGGMVGNTWLANDINQLVCDEVTCWWVILQQTLNVPKAGTVAMLIPDDVAGC